jgi:CobQ-like glutamine amidotransferase family enzyme
MIVRDGPLLVVSAYPELTLPQGDDGNVLLLAHRARAHGIEVETRTVHCGDELPAADVYVTGGLEDEDQGELATWLDAGGELRRAVEAGAAVLAVNSGYQVLGTRFALPDGTERDGLGLLDVRTRRGDAWIDGPVVSRPNDDLGLPVLSGYESHYGVTELGPGVAPLALLEIGHGNAGGGSHSASESDAAPASDGAVVGRVIGTYLHGPALARNPELADLLLSLVLGRTLDPLPTSFAEESRQARIAEARDWVRRGRPHVKM